MSGVTAPRSGTPRPELVYLIPIKRFALTALVAAGALTGGLAITHARAATAYIAPDIQTTTRDHMQMTLHAPQQPGDSARADAIVAAARKVMAQYPTVGAAEKAGFQKFLPNIPLPIEHYTNHSYAVERTSASSTRCIRRH